MKQVSNKEGLKNDFFGVQPLNNMMIPGAKGHAFHACMKEHEMRSNPCIIVDKIPFVRNIIIYHSKNNFAFFLRLFEIV